MQQRSSSKLGRFQVMIRSINFSVGARLLTRPAASSAAGAELTLFYRLSTYCLN